MNKIVLNDTVVAEKVAAHEAELAQLAKPATIEEAEAALSNATPEDITSFLPKGTIAGFLRRARKGGVTQTYGFISSHVGDVFVPPQLASAYTDDEVVAVLVSDGPRGPSASKIAPIADFISWHKAEILDNVVGAINSAKKQKLERKTRRDPTDGWNEMKTKCKTLGLELREIVKETKSYNYGGRGSDYYRFSTPITKEKAEEVLTALGTRHADGCDGGYYHGDDVITLTENGFRNDWCGPWTD